VFDVIDFLCTGPLLVIINIGVLRESIYHSYRIQDSN